MKTRKSKVDYNTKYNKSNTVGVMVRLNKKTDADIIKALSTVENKSGLVKSLLRREGYGDIIKEFEKTVTPPNCLRDPDRREELEERYKRP